MLAALVDHNEVNLAEGGRRRPAHFAIRSRPLVIEDTVNRVDTDVLDTVLLGLMVCLPALFLLSASLASRCRSD